MWTRGVLVAVRTKLHSGSRLRHENKGCRGLDCTGRDKVNNRAIGVIDTELEAKADDVERVM